MKKCFKATITRTGGKTLIPLPFDPDDAWGWKEHHYVDAVGGFGRSPD